MQNRYIHSIDYFLYHLLPYLPNKITIAQWGESHTQQTKLYYQNIITILSFAVFNISSAYYGNVAQENTTFTLITLPNNIILTFHM